MILEKLKQDETLLFWETFNAFSGKADPPLRMRAMLSLRRLTRLPPHVEIAIRNTFCTL